MFVGGAGFLLHSHWLPLLYYKPRKQDIFSFFLTVPRISPNVGWLLLEWVSDQARDGQPGLHCGPSRAIVLVISAAGKSWKFLKSTFHFQKKFFHLFLPELLTESREVSTHISEPKMCRVGYQYLSPLRFYLIWAPIGEGSRGDPNISLLAKVTLWSQVLSPQRANCSMEVRVSSYSVQLMNLASVLTAHIG